MDKRNLRRISNCALFGAALLLFAGDGPSWAQPRFTEYHGTDPNRIPAELKPYFVTGGLDIIDIEVKDGIPQFSYSLRGPWFKRHPNDIQQVADSVGVTIQMGVSNKMFDWAAEADRDFRAYKDSQARKCAEWTNSQKDTRCEHITLGPDAVGIAVITGPGGDRPGVSDDYAVRLHDKYNTVIHLIGGFPSNTSNAETPAKSIAAKLSGTASTPALAPQRMMGPVAQAGTAQRVTDTATTQWQKVPTRNQAEKNIIGKNAFVIARGTDGLLVCSVNSGAKEKFNRTPGAVPPPRLLDDKSLIGRALATLDLAQADMSGLLDGLSTPEANIPAEIRERSYMLWEPNRIQYYLYGAQLNYAPELAIGLQKTDWRSGSPLLRFISSEHGSCRGTINGGGDFINYVAPPEGEARLIPIAASPLASQTVTVELPGTRVTMPASTLAAIDLAPNGVAALAVVSGSAQITELATGARRSVGPGQFAVSAPGLGLSTALAVSAAASQSLKQAQRGPGAARPSGTTSVGSIFDIQTARDVAVGQPVGAGDVFTPGTEPVFVWFHHQGLAAGQRIQAVWYYLETAQPLQIGRGEITVQPTSNWGQFSYSLADGKKWPQGRYRVDLLVEGRLAGSASFRVAAAPEAAPSAPMTYSDPVAGYSLTMSAQWAKDDSAATGILRLINPDRTVALELQSIQSDGRIPDSALFAQIEGSFRQDPGYSIESSGPEFVAILNRTAYRMMLHVKAEDQLRSVLLVPRGPRGFNRDFYLVKIVGGPARREEIGQAMGQFVAGFHAN